MELLVVNIIKVLGEGGFSFVYLAQDDHSGVSSLHNRTPDRT
jgi:serine/threonine protein kinase